MTLTIHNIAKEYGLLPSKVLASATTFDLYVIDTATRWQNRDPEEPTVPKERNYTQAELAEILKQHKERNK